MSELEPEMDSLKEQARSLRQPADQERWRGDPVWRRLIYLGLLCAVLGFAIFLLVFPDIRLRLIARAGTAWARLAETSVPQRGGPGEVFKLPPPPPRPVQTRIVQPAPQVTFRGQEEFSGVLYADQAGRAATGREGLEEKPQPTLLKTAQVQEAFSLLKEKSETVRKLVDNAFPGYRFQAWKPVKIDPPEFWIELETWKESSQETLRFTWSIQVEKGQVRALSQAARDLEQAVAKN